MGHDGVKSVSFQCHVSMPFCLIMVTTSRVLRQSTKGLLHGYEWGLRFGGLELRFG